MKLGDGEGGGWTGVGDELRDWGKSRGCRSSF
jgi:hypothetical protein